MPGGWAPGLSAQATLVAVTLQADHSPLAQDCLPGLHEGPHVLTLPSMQLHLRFSSTPQSQSLSLLSQISLPGLVPPEQFPHWPDEQVCVPGLHSPTFEPQAFVEPSAHPEGGGVLMHELVL